MIGERRERHGATQFACTHVAMRPAFKLTGTSQFDQLNEIVAFVILELESGVK